MPNFDYHGYQNNIAAHSSHMASHYTPMMHHSHYPMNHMTVLPHGSEGEPQPSTSHEDVPSSLVKSQTERAISTGSSQPNESRSSTDSPTTSNISYQEIDFYTHL